MNVQNVVKTITIRAKAEGVPEATQALKGMQAAHEGIAKSAETSARGQLSLADAVSKAERRFNTALRAQQDYEKLQGQLNRAVAQNPALQERANAVLALASAHFSQAASGSRAFASAQAELQTRSMALAGSLGTFGAMLGSIGPAGLAVGAGLGLMVLGANKFAQSFDKFADDAGKMVDFSQSVSITTTEIQKLTKAGAEVGIGADKITTNFERFSYEVDKVRDGGGELFKQLVRINPELVEQMATARGAAAAFEVLARAQARAADVEQRASLMRAAFGRGGVQMGRLADQVNTAGSVAALALSRFAPSDAELRRWDELGDKIKATSKEAHDNMLSIFSDDVLNAQLKFYQGLLSLTEWMKGFKASDNWQGFIADLRWMSDALSQGMSDPSVPRRGTNPGRIGARSMTGVGDMGMESAAQAPASLPGGGFDEAGMAAMTAASVERELAARVQINNLAQFKREIEAQSLAQTEGVLAATMQLAQLYPGMTVEAAKQIDALNGQLFVAQARTAAERLIRQEIVTQEQVYLRTGDAARATLVAALQRKIAEEQVNAAAQQQLVALQQQGELLRASSDWERDRIKAAQTYTKLLDDGVDSLKAQQIASQQLANADLDRSAREQADAQREAAQEAERVSQSIRQANQESAQFNRIWNANKRVFEDMSEQLKFVALHTPSFDRDTGIVTIPDTSGLSRSNQGGFSQFDPGGYKFTTPTVEAQFANYSYGAGGFDPNTLQPNAQGFANLVNSYLGGSRSMTTMNWQSGGGIMGAIEGLLSGRSGGGGGMFGGGGIDPGALQTAQRLIQLLPDDEQKAGALERIIAGVRATPQTIEREELLSQLTQSLDQLRSSTDDLNGTIGSVLSPYYTQDPRTSKLGFRTFADGGIMTPWGRVPLKQYAGGGIAYGPQLSMFGEGSTPEAYVPVPSGHIPVQFTNPANSNERRPINVRIEVNVPNGRRDEMKRGAQIMAQELTRAMAGAR